MIKSSSLADFNQTTQSLSADLKLLNKKQKIINNPSVAQMRSSPMGTVAPWFSYGNPRIFEGFFFFPLRSPEEPSGRSLSPQVCGRSQQGGHQVFTLPEMSQNRP